MPKVRRKPPSQHLVIVDTNLLWDRDKRLPVSPAFDAFWSKNSPLIPMTLHVPEVVLGELQFQQTTSALKALTTINDTYAELAGITGSRYSHKCNESTIKTQVRSKLDRWVTARGAQLVPTPITQIDWAAIVDAAVWRKSPFTFDPKDQKNEKGFRDAVILETVVHACKNAGSDKMVIFVCNDYLLRTASESRLTASKKFLAFESLTDFESYINLTQQELTNAFVKSIQSHARAKFYSKNDPRCIYIKHDLGNKIQADFAADLEFLDHSNGALNLQAQAIGSVSPGTKPVRQTFLIKSTQFAKLEGTREFHWISRIDLVRVYVLQQQEGLIVSAMPPAKRIQVVSFNVKWKANVKADGRFHDIEIEELEMKETQVLDATEENLNQWRVA